ncbi:TPA: cytochrome ubiquinol oxidase subunit I [Stenotrophomonas maltophilia]|nr:cytochrome ubiquinol oxidase subunit I [Stenotrophomonas maltophilia]
MDALLLSRIQFGFLISFHVLFPAFTIGLASWLAFVEWRWLRTSSNVWRDLYFFWQRIFAVSFGMGVVSGIVMAFQFGTNWPRLSQVAGTVIGPLLTYEVLTAFFLEASFLGVMMFGWGRVSPRLHFLSTCMVALGTLCSTLWILASNSWLQTPAGYEVVNGIVHPLDWLLIIFNPSFPYRLAHMALASFITTCFVVGGIGALYIRRGRHVEAGMKMLRCAVIFAALAVPIQMFIGDMHGLNTLKHQPMKIAAIEAHWDHGDAEEEGVPLVLFAIPNQQDEQNRYEIAIPRLGSLILTHSIDGTFAPLTSVPASDRPPVLPVFFAFRIMVGLGCLMLLVSWISLFTLRRERLFGSAALLKAWMIMLPSGFLALVAGWFVTEMGRQPWVVYQVLRTADAVGPQTAWMTILSLFAYAASYGFIFGWGAWYLITILRRGPEPLEVAPSLNGAERRPARPISAADDSL